MKITTKSAVFHRLLFGEVYPENSLETGRVFRELVLKNPVKFDFFFRDLSEALLDKPLCISIRVYKFLSPKNENVPQNFSQGGKLPPSIQILAQTLNRFNKQNKNSELAAHNFTQILHTYHTKSGKI